MNKNGVKNMWKKLLSKKVALAIVTAVIVIGSALGTAGVVKYGCLAERLLGGEASVECKAE